MCAGLRQDDQYKRFLAGLLAYAPKRKSGRHARCRPLFPFMQRSFLRFFPLVDAASQSIKGGCDDGQQNDVLRGRLRAERIDEFCR